MKKVLSFLLAAVMAASLLSGCSSGSQDNAETGSTQQKDQVQVSEKGVYPVVEETLEFTIFTPNVASQVTDYEDNKLTKYMEEMTNMKVNWMFAPEKEAGQKVNLLLSANKDLPDVFMGQDLNITTNLMTYVDQGMFVPLNDYIENESVYFKKMLEEQPRIKELLTAPDGNIYNMPLVNPSFPNSVSKKLWVNKVWLDNLGLDVPTTTEEFKEMLIAFRDQDPNGNGKQDEIPFIGATTGWNTDVETFIMNAFTQFNNVTPYNIVDGKVQAEYVTDGYREGLKFLNELVEEGLLDTTSFTQDIAQLKQLFENEECAVIGVLPAGGPNAFANMTGTRYHDYVVIPPLEGPDGFQLTAYMPDNMMMYECFITSACENPLAVFKYFDAFYSEDVSMRSRYGEPGVDWVVPPEGSKNLLGGQATHEGLWNWGTPTNICWAQKNPGYATFTGQELRSEDPYELQRFLAEASELYRPYLPDVDTIMPVLIYDLEDTRKMADINITLNDYVKDARVKFITGVYDIDTQWESYLEEVEKIGYKTVLEIMQNRIDQQ